MSRSLKVFPQFLLHNIQLGSTWSYRLSLVDGVVHSTEIKATVQIYRLRLRFETLGHSSLKHQIPFDSQQLEISKFKKKKLSYHRNKRIIKQTLCYQESFLLNIILTSEQRGDHFDINYWDRAQLKNGEMISKNLLKLCVQELLTMYRLPIHHTSLWYNYLQWGFESLLGGRMSFKFSFRRLIALSIVCMCESFWYPRAPVPAKR